MTGEKKKTILQNAALDFLQAEKAIDFNARQSFLVPLVGDGRIANPV